MMLSKWLMFVFLISCVQGIGLQRRLDYSSVTERTMKTILESCYENDSLSNPIVIFGDFNVLIHKRSIIRMDNSLDINEAYEKRQLLTAAASKIIVTIHSSPELMSDLMMLKKTRWWNPMTPHFIIDESNRPCGREYILDNLLTAWDLSIINSIYICAESRNTSVLYTLNRMANHAPYPWKLKGAMQFFNSRDTAYAFERVFNADLPCKNIHYDKTKWLHGHEIKIVAFQHTDEPHWPALDCSDIRRIPPYIDDELLYSAITTINARCRLEFEKKGSKLFKHLAESTADLLFHSSLFDFSPNIIGNLSPHKKITIVAVIALNREVRTLEKICKLWSTPVLILAAIVFTISTTILIMKSNEWFAAILDALRLLTYRPILTNDGNHSFRIYFTSMLIFMIIGNGIFQGSIVAFLIKQERAGAVETIDELLKMEYRMYTPIGMLDLAKEYCPRCEFEEVQPDACMEYVLNSTNQACITNKEYYETSNISFFLNCVKETLELGFVNFKFRYNWPLANRFNDMILRHVECGIIDHWQMKDTAVIKHKRQAMEAEQSPVQYTPVKHYELKFAFQLLALGLSLSTVVFFFELLLVRISKVS